MEGRRSEKLGVIRKQKNTLRARWEVFGRLDVLARRQTRGFMRIVQIPAFAPSFARDMDAIPRIGPFERLHPIIASCHEHSADRWCASRNMSSKAGSMSGRIEEARSACSNAPLFHDRPQPNLGSSRLDPPPSGDIPQERSLAVLCRTAVGQLGSGLLQAL